MHRRKAIFHLFFLGALLSIGVGTPLSGAFSQTSAEAIGDSIRWALTREGFQGVVVKEMDNELVIGYENRRYRFEVRAMEEILRLVAPYACDNYTSLVLLPKSHNISVSRVRFSMSDICNTGTTLGAIPASGLDASFSLGPYRQLLRKNSQGLSTANYRAVFELEPQIRLALGSYTDNVQHQFNLLPAVNIYLWTGMRLTLQGIIPVSNEIKIPEQDWVRPGYLTANQFVRLPADFFASITAGYFSDQRYGVNVELGKVLANGALQWQASVGYTGFASYPKTLDYKKPVRGWQFSDLNYFDYRTALTYRPPWWDLRFTLEAGRYLLEEKGIRFSVIRQFTEVDIGFFGQKSDRGANYGFQLSVPLFPSRYMRPGLLQFRPSKHIRYTYFATQRYLADYHTGNDFDDFLKKLNPIFLRNQLSMTGKR